MSILLRATSLFKSYPSHGRGHGPRVIAVDSVDLEVGAGQSLAIAGESGCGKSTLARLLLALERPERGSVSFDGSPISDMRESALRPLRRRFQAVFQDPSSSLNPHLRIHDLIAEPLVAHRIGSFSQRQRRVNELLDTVQLPQSSASMYPSALSVGQRQRVAIARALAPAPELLILDEPVSSLDATVRARIVKLLQKLQMTLGLTLVFITHDLDLVPHLSSDLAIMYQGRIVETGPTQTILDHPSHQYSQELIEGRSRLIAP